MSINGVAASAQSTGTSSARGRYQEQYATFLQLLTTQLRNQNPLEPMNTNEFTQQVVAYSSLEQQINTNSSLDALLAVAGEFANSSALNYVGDVIAYEGTSARLAGGEARWSYDLPRASAATTVTIRDASGMTVRTMNGATSGGSHGVVWNGRTDDGRTAPDGVYTIQVEARDADGAVIAAKTMITGKVDAVDLSQAAPQLVVNGTPIPLSAVRAVLANAA